MQLLRVSAAVTEVDASPPLTQQLPAVPPPTPCLLACLVTHSGAGHSPHCGRHLWAELCHRLPVPEGQVSVADDGQAACARNSATHREFIHAQPAVLS
jgi:hypothetical protein